jgi:hypothetical protein
MPNHVKNVLKFKKLTEEDKRFLLDLICSPVEDDAGGISLHIDFDRIIPEPKEESECPDQFKAHEYSHVEGDKDRPWFDWYRWHNFYWDTKWNAYDSYTMVNKSSITFVFNTAWTMALPVIQRLKILGYDFELRWADEDWGHNCGKITYNASEQDWQEAWEGDAYKDPTAFSQRLWRDY